MYHLYFLDWIGGLAFSHIISYFAGTENVASSSVGAGLVNHLFSFLAAQTRLLFLLLCFKAGILRIAVSIASCNAKS